MTTVAATPERAAGDPIPAECCVIRVHVTELRQLFNSIDPSPFRSRDLDPKAEEFIVGWAKDFGRSQQLALVVSIDGSAGAPGEAAVLREAVHEFFRQRALGQRQRLRELMRVGRISLAIGLVALASAVMIGNFLASLMKGGEVGQILREMLFIGGWVSMWRPLEIFLYDSTKHRQAPHAYSAASNSAARVHHRLLRNADQVADRPVERQPGSVLPADVSGESRHHERHHLLLLRIHPRRGRIELHQELRHHHQDRQDVMRIRSLQVGQPVPLGVAQLHHLRQHVEERHQERKGDQGRNAAAEHVHAFSSSAAP